MSCSCRSATRRPTSRQTFVPGTTCYTNSVVVLDARTGKLKWHHQFDPNDGFDYDLGAAPALYTSGKGSKLLVAGSKDGHLYGIDRATQKVVFKTAVTTIKRSPTPPTKEGTEACPGALGGVEWNGPAVDPSSRAIYVGSVDWCFILTLKPPVVYKAGQFYFGGDQEGSPTRVAGSTGSTATAAMFCGSTTPKPRSLPA